MFGFSLHTNERTQNESQAKYYSGHSDPVQHLSSNLWMNTGVDLFENDGISTFYLKMAE